VKLLIIQRKIDLRTAHDSYKHWRKTDHDDLLLAVCLACCGAVRTRGRAVAVDSNGRTRPLPRVTRKPSVCWVDDSGIMTMLRR
jgi:hypothetical protein